MKIVIFCDDWVWLPRLWHVWRVKPYERGYGFRWYLVFGWLAWGVEVTA